MTYVKLSYVKIRYPYLRESLLCDRLGVKIRYAVCQSRDNQGALSRHLWFGHSGGGESIVKPTENGRLFVLKGGDAYAKSRATCSSDQRASCFSLSAWQIQ